MSFVTLTLVMGSRFTFGVFYPSSGILRSVGSVIWGSISDRTTREGSFTISAGLGLIALPCLISVQTSPDTWRVVLFVLLIGLGYSGTSVLYGTAAADLFQGPHFGKILGILDMGFGLGAASFYMVIGLILVSILTMWRAAPRLARTQSEAFASTPAES